MKIYLDNILIYEQVNDFETLNKSWKEITKQIFNDNRFIKQVIIDNQEFSFDYDVYLLERFRQVKTVEVFTITQMEGIIETLQEVRSYNEKLLKSIEHIAECFYGEPGKNDWELFGQFSQGIDWLYDTLIFLQSSMSKMNIFETTLPYIERSINKFREHIPIIHQSLEEEDFVLVGDILQYEFKPIFELLDKGMGEIRE